MMKQNNCKKFFRPQQTHFIGVLPSDDLTLTLEDCRRYMGECYGCKSGYGTPIHVTLLPPFRLSEGYSTGDLVQTLKTGLSDCVGGASFDAGVEGFDAFGDRTIFAKVLADEKWEGLRDKVFSLVSQAFPGCVKKDARPFQPHLTVANRDIPAGASVAALKTLAELELSDGFPVDNVTVFERVDGKWRVACSVCI